jgi:hypothetical protein
MSRFGSEVLRSKDVALKVSAVLAAALAVASCARQHSGAARDQPSYTSCAQITPTHYVATNGRYDVVDVNTAIDRAVGGLDSASFVDYHLSGDPPHEYPDSSGQWWYATVSGPSALDGAALKMDWEAALAQGSIAEQISGDEVCDLAHVIRGSSVKLELPDGSTRFLGGGAGDISPDQLFADQASNSTDEEIVQQVEDALGRYPLTTDGVDVLHPLGAAVAVVATVEQANDIKGQYEAIRSSVLGDPLRFEGLYLEIDTPDGEPLVRSGTSYRSGAGMVWFAPGMDEVLGIAHG